MIPLISLTTYLCVLMFRPHQNSYWKGMWSSLKKIFLLLCRVARSSYISKTHVIKKHVDNRGFAPMKIVLEKKGMVFNSSFQSKSSINGHISVVALLHILTNSKIGMDKNKKKEQLSTELDLVLERTAVSNMKPKEASTKPPKKTSHHFRQIHTEIFWEICQIFVQAYRQI